MIETFRYRGKEYVNNFYRDTLDQRIVTDVRNRTGRIIDVQGGYPHGTQYNETVNAWPTLVAATPPADNDHDGMPDSWEHSNGLNANNAADRNGQPLTVIPTCRITSTALPVSTRLLPVKSK